MKSAKKQTVSYLKFSVICLIEIYQRFFSFDRGLLMVLAPGGACKYPITCSEFTKLAVYKEGVLKGLYKGTRRVISCR